MTQTIDSIKLKAAAEHLEWACQQYPQVAQVQDLYQGLLPMIQAAKLALITDVMDMQDIPFNWSVNAEGLYDKYEDPNIGNAYVAFTTEMEGGLTEQDLNLRADTEIMLHSVRAGVRS